MDTAKYFQEGLAECFALAIKHCGLLKRLLIYYLL
jgi:hypothetical protein